ncbi:tripartite tricarboxylate transporter substrate binding protein [Rhodobacterales bacterium HKCCE2091]|nr:tripartite tricarboxylate transporter substrate binding protein [Rhodobacterales bacterium HKCCE2091]
MTMRLLTALPLAIALAMPAAAQDSYPDRSVRIVHGFGAGGNADTVSRILADAMTEGLGQPVVVESRPGAGGTLASGYVAAADPDGYTLQLMVGGHTVAAGLYTSLPYESVDDFTFLSIIGQFPFFIAARSGEYETLAEVIEAATADPGSIRIGHSGVGSTQHLTGELLDIETSADFLHVPYAGGAAAVTAMMGGEVDLVIDTGTAIFGQADAGVLDVLAVTSSERWPDNPDVPTVAETVAPGFNVVSWTGLGAPAGLPDDVVEVLTAEISRVMALEAVRERIAALGAAPVGSSSAEFQELVEGQIATWTEVIETAGVERR